MTDNYFADKYREACRNTCSAYKEYSSSKSTNELFKAIHDEKIALIEFVTQEPFDRKGFDNSAIQVVPDNVQAMRIRADVMDCFGMDTVAIDNLIAMRSRKSEPLAMIPGTEDWGL